MLLLIVIFQEESFVPVLLKRKAAHIRFTEKRLWRGVRVRR